MESQGTQPLSVYSILRLLETRAAAWCGSYVSTKMKHATNEHAQVVPRLNVGWDENERQPLSNILQLINRQSLGIRRSLTRQSSTEC